MIRDWWRTFALCLLIHGVWVPNSIASDSDHEDVILQPIAAAASQESGNGTEQKSPDTISCLRNSFNDTQTIFELAGQNPNLNQDNKFLYEVFCEYNEHIELFRPALKLIADRSSNNELFCTRLNI